MATATGTIAPPIPTPATPPPAEPQRIDPLDHPFRLTVDRYFRMVESGILNEKDPIYLWKGRLVAKMSKGPRHIFASRRLNRALDRIVPDGWFVLQEPSIALPDGVPEPDFTVVRGSDTDYTARWATAADVALIVEVSDSSLAMDRGTVLEAYAAARIPIYWIVNLRDFLIEVYSDPAGDPGVAHYRTKLTFGPGQDVPVVLDGREVGRVPVKDILP